MDQDERVYMVMSEDENGDAYLFASGDQGRTEAALRWMGERFGDARGNWLEPSAVPPRPTN